jgi:hypothetical protein
MGQFLRHRWFGGGRADRIAVRRRDADCAKTDASHAGSQRCFRHADHRSFQRGFAIVGAGPRPMASDHDPAVLWAVVGSCGTLYSLNVIRRMRKQGVYEPELEDWLFHVVLPVAAYVIMTLSAVAALSYTSEALFGIGAAALLLLFIGIHNAWDAVFYHVFFSKRD